MGKANRLLSLLPESNFKESVDQYKDSLSKAQTPKYRQDIIKNAFAKGDKFAVRQGLMMMNKEKKLDPKEYNALLDYWGSLDTKAPAAAGASKSQGFLGRFFK